MKFKLPWFGGARLVSVGKEDVDAARTLTSKEGELTTTKDVGSARPVGTRTSWWGTIRESFTGAWQRNVEIEPLQNVLAFSAVYSCLSLISNDISKLRPKLIYKKKTGIWTEVTANSPFLPVIRKPNRFQTRIQFLSLWMISKLVYGNTFVYKQRDQRGIVTALYILDPRLVTTLVANDGSVWYRLGQDDLSQINKENTVPASEMIHDRAICLFHPLVGVPPIFACGVSTTQGIRIQANSERFFANMSMPSGQLTSPHTIDDVTAERLKKTFEQGTTGVNIGRLFVGGDGLKYDPFGMIPPQHAQLIEQLKYTAEDVARCFGVPLYKIGGTQPKFSNAAQANDDYYKQCLQNPIEAIELLMEEGLSLTGLTNAADDAGVGMSVELELDGLLRMDPMARAEKNARLITAGMLSPNEGRADEDLDPKEGGDELFLQQQMWPVRKLAAEDRPLPGAKNPAAPNAPKLPAPTETPAPQPAPKDKVLPAPEDAAFRDFLSEVEVFEDFAASIRKEIEASEW